ncbi:MAG TPA: helix-turn-helix domain-containing protein [Ensifer sp.]|nr:helix-turn-helix domain-containing protein [Ensifer sp.]
MTKPVPTYDLYGEQSGRKPSVWLHCETIPSRSSLHHWEIRVHRHESFFQILYLQAGSGDAIFGEEKHTLRPLSFITVPPGVNHGFRFSKDIDGFVITVLASRLRASPGDRSHLGAWLAVPRVTHLDPGDPEGAYVAGTLTRLGAEYAEQRTGRNDLLEAYVILALQLTARLSQGGEGEATDENGRRMERLNGLVHRHLRTHQPAAFYAAELGISPTHLNRFVKAMTGHGAHELITRKLLEEAKRELIFSFGSVQEIGYRLGFADPAYFSRFFLKRTGNTPRAWRIAERNKLATVSV